MKVCFECEIEKEDHEYYKNKNLPSGLDIRCKECQKKFEKGSSALYAKQDVVSGITLQYRTAWKGHFLLARSNV